MTAAVSTAASDQLAFLFDISPTDTAVGAQAKEDHSSPDFWNYYFGIKVSTHGAGPAQGP